MLVGTLLYPQAIKDDLIYETLRTVLCCVQAIVDNVAFQNKIHIYVSAMVKSGNAINSARWLQRAVQLIFRQREYRSSRIALL